jgi:hypothetical protein
LCEADEAARQAIAEHEAASRQTEEARGRLDSAAEQIAREHETSREPKN